MGVSTTIAQIGFFLLAFALYLAFVYFTRSTVCSLNTSKAIIVFVAIIYTLALFGYMKIFKPFNAEPYQYENAKSAAGHIHAVEKPSAPWV